MTSYRKYGFVKRAREEWRTLLLIILSTNHMDEPDGL
jgi:hypothetical protein